MRSLAVLLAIASPLHAQPAPDEASVNRAQACFLAGRTLYRTGQYEEALHQFEAGYAIVPRPEFLLNIGLTQRHLFRPQKARSALVRYLKEAPPDAANRATAQQIIDELERGLKEDQPPPSPEPAASPAPTLVAPPLPPPVAAAHSKPSFLRRHWWIFPAGAAVIVGVSLGLYFGLRPAPCPANVVCIPGN